MYLGRKSIMRFDININNLEETQVLAKKLAEIVEPQDTITLEGDLGAGKTTFTQAFAKGLGITRTVNSPTFTIMKQYNGRLPLNHLDVYRLEDSDEDLGWDEIFYGDAVTVVEWAHLIERDLPSERLAIEIRRIDDNARRITLIPFGKRYEMLCEELVK
jgi:tRNA threonylcarbamoyladenosine biosynthesis protein TsaE